MLGPKYYCPYCSQRYQIVLKKVNGQRFCGHCGDPMVRKKAIQGKQLFAVIGIIALLSPLLISIAALVKLEREKNIEETFFSKISLKNVN